jgi:hypothetical protein
VFATILFPFVPLSLKLSAGGAVFATILFTFFPSSKTSQVWHMRCCRMTAMTGFGVIVHWFWLQGAVVELSWGWVVVATSLWEAVVSQP